MTVFQGIAAPVALLLAVRSAVQLTRGVRPRWWPVASGAVWAGAAVAILWPDVTTDVARRLGIGRGADLVMYVVTILFIASFFYLLQRFRRIEAELTQLVRMLALRDARAPSPAAAERDPQAPRAPGPASPGTPPAP